MQSKNSEKRSFCPLIFKQKHFKYIRIPLLLLLVSERKITARKKSVSRVAEVEPLKGRTSQEAINRGSKNEGDKAKGDLASHDFFGGGGNCSPSRTPITHATPLKTVAKF